jgi:hypothetical protein
LLLNTAGNVFRDCRSESQQVCGHKHGEDVRKIVEI